MTQMPYEQVSSSDVSRLHNGSGELLKARSMLIRITIGSTNKPRNQRSSLPTFIASAFVRKYRITTRSTATPIPEHQIAPRAKRLLRLRLRGDLTSQSGPDPRIAHHAWTDFLAAGVESAECTMQFLGDRDVGFL